MKKFIKKLHPIFQIVYVTLCILFLGFLFGWKAQMGIILETGTAFMEQLSVSYAENAKLEEEVKIWKSKYYNNCQSTSGTPTVIHI